MRLRRLLLSAGVVAMGTMLVALAGCNKSSSDDTDTAKEMKIDNQVIKDKVTLDVYASAGKLQNYLTNAAKIYNKKNSANIKLKFTTVASGTATVQMITPKLVANEAMPDFLSISDSASAGILAKFEDSFYSASKYGFYKKHGSDFYSQKLNILKSQTESNQVIPYANDFTPALSYYQPKYFDEVGVKFSDIKSWDEYIEVAKKIKEKTGVYGIALPEAGDQEFLVDLMNQQNVPLLDEKGNINLGTNQAEKAAKIVKKMVDAGIVNFFGANDGEKAFQESAMFVAGGWYATNMSLNFPKASGNWRMSELIPFEETATSKSPISGGSSWYVPKKGKHPEIAQQFLSFILSDEDCLAQALDDGVPVSNKQAYQTASAGKEFEYFGNQKYYSIINTANTHTATAVFPASYSDATAYVSTASYKYWQTGNYQKSFLTEAKNYAEKYNVKINK